MGSIPAHPVEFAVIRMHVELNPQVYCFDEGGGVGGGGGGGGGALHVAAQAVDVLYVPLLDCSQTKLVLLQT